VIEITETQPQKRLTLEELREKTAKAIKEATTFEKSSTFDMPVGTEILFRVKRVFPGNYDGDVVISDEVRVMDKGKFVALTATDLLTYKQDGLTGPRVKTEIKPGEDVRIPSFVAKRAKSKGLEFHPKQVYWSKFLEEKKLEKGFFKLAAVDLIGVEFPEG